MAERMNGRGGRVEQPTAKGALGVSRLAAAGTASVAGIAVGLGIYPDVVASDGPANWVLPPLIGGVVGAGLGVGWHLTLGMAADARRSSVAALALGAALAVAGLGTSAWFLTAKIGGANAIQAHQLAYVEQLQKVEEAVAYNAAIEDELVTALGAGSTGMQSTARSEGTHGIVTGKVGFEKVYNILQNAAGAFLGTQTTISKHAYDRRDYLANAARDRGEAMRAIADKNTAAFEEAAGRAAANIGRADKIRLAPMVSGLGVGLVMEEARSVIEGAIGGVRSIARDIEDKRRVVSVPSYFPISAKEAVTRYPPVLAWIAAVLIEALPLFMLVILIALRRDEDEEPDDVQNVIEFEPRAAQRTATLPPAAE